MNPKRPALRARPWGGKAMTESTAIPATEDCGKCDTCLFVDHSGSASQDNCLRFARFVDHALNEVSRDCDYWTPAAGK